MEIKDQVVLVTGASRGLGAEIAKAFGREGARVIVNYNQSERKAQEVVESIGDRARAIQANILDKDQVQAMFDQAERHYGQAVTTVINNALVNFKFDAVNRKTAETVTWEEYQTQLEGSVKAALHTTQTATEGMRGLNFGRIINIGTNLFQNPVVPYHDYNTSKAALLGFTRNMARDMGAHGITVNMVSGGLLQKTDASASTPDEVFDMISENTPLKRVTTPEELADATLFFASSWSRAVTGQNLVVDGGLVMD
ncbi:3-oxoacyl-ACP reductase [Halobacillus shinanisalinarum]|uniref:3-oxoacyl-ACP reductase n=1 Tax=Halobacillus shinanisalinarum TaxID=2932258 RepID=A0ABY4GVE5_9BACI|nr:3-oxoacyl-ACP reductase [Halobacillus shinanisalinarum]UOQ92141.1 3-oxoacyl-ACP reductase [Halobacillus shinanisalinarum]